MAALSAASLESVSRSLAADLPDSVDLPLVAVGHSCGALLHSLLAAEGSYGQACVLMSFNNKPVSDAIPVPLPPRLEDSRLRGLVSRNLEEVSERVSSISTRTLVVRFANDFTDESERLKDILQEAGQQVQLLRFPGGHTAPLER
ncbi:unnamed protein product [Effrenium voratum]|nr:unnamed protein product [Effrenium voratum]